MKRPAIVPCVVLLAMLPATLQAFDLVEVLPLTERITMVHIQDGHAVHHKKGQKRTDGEKVVLTILDTGAACRADAWTVTCPDDANFAQGVHPQSVGRKSKGTDFAWMVQGWDQANNRTLNKDPDHAKGHWLYLVLPQPLTPGKTYTVKVDGIAGIEPMTLAYSFDKSRSEAVHVNVLGYLPDAPDKFAYVYHWAGDRGSVDLSFLKGRSFRLVDQKTGKAAFTAFVTFRAPANQPETGQLKDTPNGNFLCAEVWQCDFSAFSTPGTYVVAVDGVGCSFPFTIDADVYREAFRIACRGLYHNRSGIELKKPYTEFERPAPHNPLVTPGFAGKLVYTTSRFIDWKNGDADRADKPAIEAGIKGAVDVWGWYQDAGDWDSYASHTNVATTLCFAYETAPGNFKDGELNIPESGNGVPDILDEAAWLPRFCFRLRHELVKKGWGTGGVGLRVCGDHFGGDCRKDDTTKGSWEDTDRQWIVSGEDPVSTFRYAATAAHLAWCLQLSKLTDPEKVDWLAEAKESYAWALAQTQAKDEKAVKDGRCHAAAQLFRLTGSPEYETQFEKDMAGFKVGEELLWDRAYGPWAYCLGGKGKPELAQRMREGVLASCEIIALKTSGKRALRWGGHWYMPMLVGHQTTPWILDGVIGYTLTKESDPAKAKAFRGAVITTCDYFLGTNALNQTWVTGLGVRHVNEVFHMDAWYNGKGKPHPGVVPYGPWQKSQDLGAGPWDVNWPNKTVYPVIDQWPGNERWFDNRNCPLSGEFTVHQNTCYAAATYGWLCAGR
ncbi:MAG: glycoside hydrolase family 9 protein [Planctomycetota bacterium]|nr:glycoside hydrolase family 9 protein [Planctomycetota bacterium]